MVSVGVDIGGTKMVRLVEYQGEKFERTILIGKTFTPTKLREEISNFINHLSFEVDAIRFFKYQ